MKKQPNPAVLQAQMMLTATQRKSIGAGIWTGPRKREENEALSRDINVMKLPKLQAKHLEQQTYRPGAMDFLQCKSVGT